MTFPYSILVCDEDETASVAKSFTDQLMLGDIVLLSGELGSGKTTFVKYVCQSWNIQNVSSPSFAIVNEYQGNKKVYHFDFFRIKKIEELYDIGFSDYLNDSDAVTFIEWAELYKEILPSHIFNINIAFEEDGKREIIIEKR